jgi:Flp pilus assembly protein TadG
VAIFVLVMTPMGCDTESDSTSSSQSSVDPGRVVQDAFETIGGRWAPILNGSSRGSGVIVARQCVAPLTGDERRAASPVRAQVFDLPPNGVTGVTLGGPFLRVAALRYGSDAAAARAVRSMTPAVLDRCVVRAVNRYLRERDPRDSLMPVRPATSRSIDTTWVRRSSASRTTVVQSTFEEEVLGGFDNGHAVSLGVARSGPLVVTVLRVTGSQILEPRADAQLVERAATALTHRRPSTGS